MKFRRYFWLLILILMLSLMIGCSKPNSEGDIQKQEPVPITLATTTSTDDSGLLNEILPVFEAENNIKVKVIAVGTGQAIDLGKRGDADVLLVHARKAEDEFMAEGYGKVRKDVMYNDFIIVGPANDPAGITGLKVEEAMRKILSSEAVFVSRGDDSGTHKKELSLWEKAGLQPEGAWYLSVGQGMGATLQIANEKQGYTLTDRATYLARKGDFELEVLGEGEPALLNPYGVIAVNPEKFSHVKYDEAMLFIGFLTSSEGQELIGKFGVEEFGQPLFFPDAK